VTGARGATTPSRASFVLLCPGSALSPDRPARLREQTWLPIRCDRAQQRCPRDVLPPRGVLEQQLRADQTCIHRRPRPVDGCLRGLRNGLETPAAYGESAMAPGQPRQAGLSAPALSHGVRGGPGVSAPEHIALAAATHPAAGEDTQPGGAVRSRVQLLTGKAPSAATVPQVDSGGVGFRHERPLTYLPRSPHVPLVMRPI
jgi:hypothetical protein